MSDTTTSAKFRESASVLKDIFIYRYFQLDIDKFLISIIFSGVNDKLCARSSRIPSSRPVLYKYKIYYILTVFYFYNNS